MQSDSNTNSRRRFLHTLTGAGAAALATGLIPPAQAQLLRLADPAKGHIFLTPPYLQAPSATSITVMWLCNMPAYSWVEYGDTPALGSKAHSITDGLVDAYNRINRVTLHGLQPGTKYYYRVCSKEITRFEPYQLDYGNTLQSEVHQFTTYAEKLQQVSWLIMNDIHDRPASISHLASLHKGDAYDFVFFNGDVFDYQHDEQQIIDHMLQPCTDSFATQTPFLYVRGNHETRGKYRDQLHHYFHNPQGRQYFSFTHGPVHFTVLDTGEDKPDDTPVYAGIVDFDGYRAQQAHWLQEVMETTAYRKAAFRVVLMHIPPFHAGEWHGTNHCREQFSGLFDKHGVDLCICGHTHQHGVYAPVKGLHQYPILIGGGPEVGRRTLMHVQANQHQLLLTMLDDNGKEVGRYEIKK